VDVLQKIEAEERRREEHVALLQKNEIQNVHGKEEQVEDKQGRRNGCSDKLSVGIRTKIVMVLKCVLFVFFSLYY
jgi:hypothetical protein